MEVLAALAPQKMPNLPIEEILIVMVPLITAMLFANGVDALSNCRDGEMVTSFLMTILSVPFALYLFEINKIHGLLQILIFVASFEFVLLLAVLTIPRKPLQEEE